jgi:hypothetical protein
VAQVERPGKFPSMSQAGVYSAVTHYLKTVDALKSDADGKAVVAKMKELPTDEPLFGKGYVSDGRKIHPAYVFEVKKPEESKYPGDDYKLRATIPAAEAFRPLKEGGCPMINGCSGVWPGHYSLYSRSHSAPCVFSESIGKIYLGVFRVCQRAPLIAWPEMVALVHAKCFPAREAASLGRLIVGLRKAGLAA